MPFSSVGYNTIDIQQIKLDDGGTGVIGWGQEMFQLWEGAPTVVDGSVFYYWDKSYDPACEATDFYWGDGDTYEKVAAYPIPAGKSFVINSANESITATMEPPYTLNK